MTLRTVGAALVLYNLYRSATEATTGTGTPGDPIRVTTVSPLLALIGSVLMLVEE